MIDLHRQSVDFKNRILDFFDVFVRKQSANPVILHVILPLLRLVTKTSASEKDLATKAGGILRNKLSHVKEVPSTADAKQVKELLVEIHTQARRAATQELTNTCSACSLFLIRTLDASSSQSTAGVDTYKQTLKDLMTRKRTLVRVPFLAEYIKRYPAKAFPLALDLTTYLVSKDIKQSFKRVQALTLLSIFAQQFKLVAESTSRDQLEEFVSKSIQGTYDLLEGINDTEEKWDKGQIREIVKFQLSLARTSKNALGVDILSKWDENRLDRLMVSLEKGEKTGQLKGLQNELKQLKSLISNLTSSDKKGKKQLNGTNEKEDEEMDLDEPVSAEPPKSSKKKGETDGKVKKRKSLDGKVKESKKAKVAA